jgi:hypothetical protein
MARAQAAKSRQIKGRIPASINPAHGGQFREFADQCAMLKCGAMARKTIA